MAPSPTFAGAVGGDDAPPIAVGAIEQALRVARECVGAHALEERRRSALSQLIAMHGQCGSAGRSRRFRVEQRAGTARCERAVICRGYRERQDPLPDALHVDADRWWTLRFRIGRRLAAAARRWPAPPLSSPVSGRNGDGSLALSTAR